MRNNNLRGMSAPLFDADTLERLYGESDRPYRAKQNGGAMPPCEMAAGAIACAALWLVAALGGWGVLYLLWSIAKGCMVIYHSL